MTSFYEDDPGAPGPDAYTAAEKEARAKAARPLLLAMVGALLILLVWWAT
jgi:hypothetical protein